ncbi:MAG TPA: redoxin family protein [Gemmatimonadaceae bacterium]|jgi:cytochrome c biogenesis protein CcmG/thiol:disulfide interchange protein DsbE|nr:redoxin family protein [Gemmatimonadaceae bacterium]
MNWKRASWTALIAIPVLVLFAWGFTRDPNNIPSPLPGRMAPDFRLPVVTPGEPPTTLPVGDTVHLASLQGRVVVLNFWASWCVSCREEHVTLQQFARRYQDQPVTFLGVLYNDFAAPARAWIKAMGGQQYPSVNDYDARTAINYGLYGVPETYFIDGAGHVAYKQTGPVTDAILTRVVDSLIAALPSAGGRPATVRGDTAAHTLAPASPRARGTP